MPAKDKVERYDLELRRRGLPLDMIPATPFRSPSKQLMEEAGLSELSPTTPDQHDTPQITDNLPTDPSL
jgi:hypothetical protein